MLCWSLLAALSTGPSVAQSVAGADPGPTPIARRSPQQVEQVPTFGARVEMVLLHVAVFDSRGAPVAGLTRDDFAVYEDGAEQEIRLLLTPDEAPLDVAFVMDISGSIRRDAPSAKRDAYNFVGALGAEDCLYLLLFNERVGPGRWGGGADPGLQDMIAEAPLGGGTALYDAIVKGLSVLQRDDLQSPVESYAAFGLAAGDAADLGASTANSPGFTRELGFDRRPESHSGCGLPAADSGSQEPAASRRRALVVLTDGLDMNSISTFAETLVAAWRADVPIFPIAAGEASRSLLRGILGSVAGTSDPLALRRIEQLKDQLRELARITGGQYLKSDSDGLRQAYDEVLNLLRASYVVGYYVPPETDTGRAPAELSWHDVEVKLRRSGMRAVTRQGYYRTENDEETARGAVRAGIESLRQSRPAEALLLLDRALQADPQHWQADYYRAVALSLLNRPAEARQASIRAIALAPEVERAQELAWLTSYRMGDYGAAWEHAIRARQAGLEMTQELQLLRRHAAEPADLRVRLDAPRVFVDDPNVPDLVVQAALAKVMRMIRSALSESEAIALVPRSRLADYLLVIDADDLSVKEPRRLKGDLELFGILGDRVYKRGLRLRDIDDPSAVAADLAQHIEDLEKELGGQRSDAA